MKRKAWLPGILGLALAAGGAQAQTPRQPTNNGAQTPGGFFIRNRETGQQPFMQNGVVFQFIPGVGFVPSESLRGFAVPAQRGQGGAVVDPRFSGGSGTNPNFGAGFGANNFGAGANTGPFGGDPRFNSGGLFGNGTFTSVSPGATIIPPNGSGGYYGGYFGDPTWTGGSYGVPQDRVVFVPVPTLPAKPLWKYTGWKGRFRGPGEARERANQGSPRVDDRDDSEESDEPKGRVVGAAATRDQQRLARRAQDLMSNRSMREGTVISIGATGVLVRYSVDGEMRSYRFPTDEVFFFRPSGAMESASTAPAELESGDRVLVPDPVGREARVSVAGTRQTQGITKRAVSARAKSAPKRAGRTRSR